jgi:hypothetical protein
MEKTKGCLQGAITTRKHSVDITWATMKRWREIYLDELKVKFSLYLTKYHVMKTSCS